MTKFFIGFLILINLANAAAIESEIISLKDDIATIKVSNIQVGISGIVVRNFTEDHSSIIAYTTVVSYDKAAQEAKIKLKKYNGLVHNALPKGLWDPKVGDTVLLAYSYKRALLIAPNESSYYNVIQRIPSLSWSSPDLFATFLSNRKALKPTKKWFRNYCTHTAVGLLYVNVADELFTMDCQSMVLLQNMPMDTKKETPELFPFFTNVTDPDKGFFGGIFNSVDTDAEYAKKDTYSPYYLGMINKFNKENPIYTAYKKKNAKD
ncbi:MAG: hypothetical protein GQ570_00105 [Helicobacteraceae bacterium]|nr:hypothetical protein [Helicobacteraceae bacterium]